jgi:protein TonB
MFHERRFLGRSLALSLILHAAIVAGIAHFHLPAPQTVPPVQPEMKVSFREPRIVPEKLEPAPAPASVPERPKLLLPKKTSPNPSAAALTAPAPRLTGVAAQKAAEQLQRELLYPREAIERGLEGEALVLLFLDASGNAVAARLEASSGHSLLDEAAVRAARTLRALPGSAPRDVLLPVRFRLR